MSMEETLHNQLVEMHNQTRIDRIYQEQNLLSSRLNMFFIAQSMLLVAYVSATQIQSTFSLDWMISVVGLLVTGLFIYVFYKGAKQIDRIIINFKNEQPGFHFDNKNSNYVLGISLPIIFMLVWIILIVDIVY